MNGSTKDLISRARFELVLPSRAEAIGACDRGGARRMVNRPTWGGRLLATRGLAAVHLVVFAALFVLPHQVRAQTDGICGRTATVRTAILAKIDGINDCGLVTSNHLAAITGVLSLNDQSITALAAGDFDGLTSLVTLFLYNNELTALPDDVFDGLTALTRLDLDQQRSRHASRRRVRRGDLAVWAASERQRADHASRRRVRRNEQARETESGSPAGPLQNSDAAIARG